MVSEYAIIEGTRVRHPKKPEWSLGEVLVVSAGSATVYFKNDNTDHRTFLLDIVRPDIANVQSEKW